MSKVVTIRINTPICQECGGAIKFYQIAEKFQCLHCGARYKVIGYGKNDKELICEKTEKSF